MSFATLLIYVTALYIRPMEWDGSPLYGVQVAGFGIMDVLTIAALLACLIKRVSEGGRIMRSATDWFIMAIFGSALMSHVAHTFFGMFHETFEKFGKIVLLYFLIVNIVDTRRKLKIFVALLVLLTAFLAVHGVLQSARGYGIGGQLPMVENGVVRVKAYGIFDDPNDLALTLVVSMPFLLMWIMNAPFVVRVMSGGLLILCSYALYLTNSRGGMMALIVMAFVYFYKRFGKVLSVVLGSLLVLGILAFGPSRIKTVEDDPSGSGRRAVWSQGLQMLKHFPVTTTFGVGWGRFGEFSGEGKTAHNSFLLAASEMGLVGLFFYLGAFYLPLRDLHRLTLAEPSDELDEEEFRTFRSDRALARAMIASLVGFAAAAFFLSRTYNQIPYVLIAIAAVLARLAKMQPVGEPALPDPGEDKLFYDFKKSDFRWLSMGTLGPILFIYLLCRVLWGF